MDVFQKRVQIPDSVLYQDLNGEAVLLSLEGEAYFGLDEVGNRFWSVLRETGSVRAAQRLLQEEYEVDRVRLEHDLRDFVERLAGYGLLALVD